VFALLASAFSAFAAGAATVALFNAALRCSQRALAAIAALSVAAVALFPLVYPTGDYLADIVLGVLITVVVVGWGLFVRARRELVVSLRERAERLEAEQRMQVEQARDAERRRIAREMHDVLAHRVSLVGLHAGALEFRRDASPEEVAHAAGVIRAASHAALEELREVIGVLRDGDGAAGPEPPQPTFAEIPDLVEESRAAGTRVALRIETRQDDPPPAVLGRTAYRVVQEGLTNARKHAPGAAVDVLLADAAEGLVVQVVSRRPVGVAAGAASPPPGTGTGLIGLAERVALAGGRLEHGPDARGDFLLRATLPRLP
jgi:signal transduction histidine kinase